MLRSLLSALLALALVAEAAAQSAPATKTTTKAKTTKTSTRPAATRNTTMKPAAASAPNSGGRNDIGPGGNGAVGSTESADGKGQSIYAAPGMPVNVDNPKKVQGYNGPAPARTKSRTTLSPR
ncbi:hypothetical protein Q5H92_03455 [Hymenobacter sp. M29]|uniref:Uncharacterized protein n=1 Tax=Hymenobacter mellowenesis TaxID=3063995 RepID=A0ABT9A6D6_9BACT|nr:hypothetical protein [Hymenobacter sp. M29]MDO7845400.1 hypothetical protein [Hymenobacter sp. M29]